MSVTGPRSRLPDEVPTHETYTAADVEGAQRARPDLAEVKLAQYIQQLVAAAPPLTPDQLARLRVLLQGSA